MKFNRSIFPVLVIACLLALSFVADVLAGLDSVAVKPGAIAIGGPARIVAFQAASTNSSGTVKIKKVTPLSVTWREDVVSTTTNYMAVSTNLYRTVTNDVVTVWRVRYLGNGVVQSNVYARAVGEIPDHPAWPDVVITTNAVAQTESYTNWTYNVVSGVTVTTNSAIRRVEKAWTNLILNATLSSGLATNAINALVFPGEWLLGEGTALTGGEANIIIER